MWYWFGAFVGFVARKPLADTDPTFGKDYLIVAEQAAKVKEWAVEQFNGMLAERQAEMRAAGYTPT